MGNINLNDWWKKQTFSTFETILRTSIKPHMTSACCGFGPVGGWENHRKPPARWGWPWSLAAIFHACWGWRRASTLQLPKCGNLKRVLFWNIYSIYIYIYIYGQLSPTWDIFTEFVVPYTIFFHSQKQMCECCERRTLKPMCFQNIFLIPKCPTHFERVQVDNCTRYARTEKVSESNTTTIFWIFRCPTVPSGKLT